MKLFNSQKFLIAILLGLSTFLISLNQFVEAQSVQEVTFDICLASENWNRPGANIQIAKLQAINRVIRGRYPQDFLNLKAKEWISDLMLFPGYYGASGGGDHNILSGIWSLPKKVLERKDKCSNQWAEVGAANSGDNYANPLIEFWLFKHRMKSIKWTGQEYIITVEPKNSGFQLGYFKNQSPEIFSFKIVNTKGKFLAKCNEWHCKFSKPK